MKIRKPTDTEVEEIISLSPEAIFAGTLGEAQPDADKVEQLVRQLLDKGSEYLIAAEEEILQGWILLGEQKDQFTGALCGYIFELFVLEEFRGNGMSKKLMNAAIARLKEAGYAEVRLSAFAGNQAIKLYESFGFEVRTVGMRLDI